MMIKIRSLKRTLRARPTLLCLLCSKNIFSRACALQVEKVFEMHDTVS